MAISMIFVQVAVASAQMLGQEGMNEEIVYQGIYYDEDGELVKTTIRKITYPSARSGEYERVTYSKENVYENYSITLTATFSYNVTNKEVSCVSKYRTYNKMTPISESLTDTGTGTKCTVRLDYRHNTGLGTKNKALRMICDYKGNLTYFGE
ncbi:hypothetical protein [Clostridium sp. MD294]|uniref:hypothetical protein n=1 Tax=Clostridium sp. MD294 TaxID=97138 RepID=UPI0002C8D321|nr:hypothetical protein [Clostridium sp. MD294]NDO46365.1 hypothetical protein [Clostridium sp. MD294]USF29208.1 hypothetical protein C820_000592 [Clostridium sp. MD294]